MEKTERNWEEENIEQQTKSLEIGKQYLHGKRETGTEGTNGERGEESKERERRTGK